MTALAEQLAIQDNLVECYMLWQSDLAQHERDKAHYERITQDPEIPDNHPIHTRMAQLLVEVNDRIIEIKAYIRSANTQLTPEQIEDSKVRVLAKWEIQSNKI